MVFLSHSGHDSTLKKNNQLNPSKYIQRIKRKTKIIKTVTFRVISKQNEKLEKCQVKNINARRLSNAIHTHKHALHIPTMENV